MKLTKKQIENLYQFTRKHYVIHYDLQTELVDHMANAIETIWENQPNLSFETARDQTFKTFGVFGFMDVVEQRHKAMNKRYIKIFLSFVKTWFTFPEVLKTLVLFSISYLVFKLSFGKYIAIGCFVLLFLWMFIKSRGYFKYIQKKEQPNQKLWLLEDLIFRNAAANGIIFLSIIINSFNTINVFWKYKYSVLIVAIIFTLTAVYTYVSVVVLPKNVKNVLKNTYPEYSM